MNYFSFQKSPEQNKARYRELVKEHHPDKNGNPEIFLAVQNEYELYQRVLKDGVKADERKAYDQMFSNTDFSSIADIEAFYNKNRKALDEILNRFVWKKRANRQMDEEIVRLGFSLGKSIFNIIKDGL